MQLQKQLHLQQCALHASVRSLACPHRPTAIGLNLATITRVACATHSLRRGLLRATTTRQAFGCTCSCRLRFVGSATMPRGSLRRPLSLTLLQQQLMRRLLRMQQHLSQQTHPFLTMAMLPKLTTRLPGQPPKWWQLHHHQRGLLPGPNPVLRHQLHYHLQEITGELYLPAPAAKSCL